MKTVQNISLVAAIAVIGVLGASPAVAACTQTGFWRDGINLTAARIVLATSQMRQLPRRAAMSASFMDREPAETSTAARCPVPTISAFS